MKKKLFISCPMKGRTEENIRNSIERMHKMAELVFDQELDVIPSYIEHTPPKDTTQAVWYLGESIKKLSEADYFIGIAYGSGFRGCDIELTVAQTYGIPFTAVRATDFCGDLVNESCFKDKEKQNDVS